MRTAADTEEREHAETEITLGTATLLSIFFGLVVVCGVFFGFGYSVGRRATSQPLPPASTTVDSSANAADPRGTKPSAQQAALTTVTQPATQSAPDTGAQDAEAASSGSRTVTVTEPVETSSKPVSEPVHPLSASSPAAISSDFMVQIAAVSHQEDAAVLVSALRKRGYNVSIRTEPQDKLLHVQVGPFAARAEAVAMKQKLLADGYNAFVK